MSKLQNDRLLKAIRHEPVDVTPIWIMRQAGRYLPEYRQLRQQAGSFLNLCKTPDLACQITLQPLLRFPLDAAILFSDILTIPDAMGLGLYFKEGEGPAFERPLHSEKEIRALAIPDPEISLGYVLEAIKLIKHELAGKVPLIGFCGSPWTLATYMIEGRAERSFPTVRRMLQQQPHLLHHLLTLLAQAVSLHLSAQIKSGIDVVMLFDTWGGILKKTEQYQQYSLHFIKQVITHIPEKQVPVILFTKGGGQWLERMAESGCQVIGVDWETDMHQARQRVGDKIALQGNMDPTILYQSPEAIQREVARILAQYGTGSGHIFNLGHGIPQDVIPDHVAVLVDAVHTLSRRYHL